MARKPKKSEEVKTDAPRVDQASETNLSSEPEDVLKDVSEGDQHLQCGEMLFAARTEQDLSAKEVAKQLRLSSTQIEALEQDDFASLPEATIVKGFIRNYAKLLKIPAEPLLSAYVQMVPEKEHYSFVLKPGINMRITEGEQSHKLRYFLIFVGTLLAASVWFFYQSYVQKPNPINLMPEFAEVLPALALPMSGHVDDIAATQLEMPAQVQKTDVGGKQSSEALETAVDKPSEMEKEKGIEHAAVAAGSEAIAETEGITSNESPILGQTRLEFSATQETWLSVVNTSGKEIYNKILFAGDRDVVDVRRPAEIVVGNAHGATLIVDGKTIDLAPYTRINVARVHMNRLR